MTEARQEETGPEEVEVVDDYPDAPLWYWWVEGTDADDTFTITIGPEEELAGETP